MSFLINPYRFAAAAATDPNFANVSLLLHGDASPIVDSSGTPKTITAFGNAAYSTAQAKFGSGSIAFDGSGDYITAPDNAGFAFGSVDFTLEFWFRASSTSGFQTVVTKRASGAVFGPFVFAINAGTLELYMSSAGASWDIATSRSFGSISTGQWYLCTLSRSGNSIRGFLDGTLAFTITSTASLLSNNSALVIGGDTGSNYFNGHLDELRITKGVARYTANFTPPTAPFPDS